MVLINKQPKLSCHMASMPINDRRLIKPVMLICFAVLSACFRVLIKYFFQTTTTLLAALSAGGGGGGGGGGGKNKPPMEFLDPFLQMSKSEFRFRW